MQFKRFIFLALVCFISDVFAQQNQNTDFQNIDVVEAQALIQDNYLNPDFIILDVRTEAEYATKHLENGVMVNYYWSEFETILDTLIKDKIYLVHCASGGRSTNVFNSMQTKGFQTVYNMTGGINSWVAASFPITTEVAPIALSISDSTLTFNTESLDTDTIVVKLTNFGNDSIRFSSVTDLSSTEFSTNFNLATKVSGLMDYEFEVYYTPEDAESDSLGFVIESDGGDLTYILKGNVTETNIEEVYANELVVYPNPCRNLINIEMQSIESLKLYDLTGKLVVAKEIGRVGKYLLKTSDLNSGIYYLSVISSKGHKTKQIFVE